MARRSDAAPCGCEPGTWENGWHEKRSAECEAVERAQWRAMLDYIRSDEYRMRVESLVSRADDE